MKVKAIDPKGGHALNLYGETMLNWSKLKDDPITLKHNLLTVKKEIKGLDNPIFIWLNKKIEEQLITLEIIIKRSKS